MNTKVFLVGALILLVMVSSSFGAATVTAHERAINSGAKQLTADEVDDLLVGGTAKARSGEKMFMFHYSRDNVLSAKLVGGDWSGTGYYGITDDNRVCVSMAKDKGRLRCITLLRDPDGTVKKYNIDGVMTFEIIETQEGKAF